METARARQRAAGDGEGERAPPIAATASSFRPLAGGRAEHELSSCDSNKAP